jgi:hypothetical protein
MTDKEQTDHAPPDDDENYDLDPEIAQYLDDDDTDEDLETYLQARRAAAKSPDPAQAKPDAKPASQPKPEPDPPILDAMVGTEVLLNNLIVECHHAMRDVAIPLAYRTGDVMTRRYFLSDAMDLAKAGAVVGKTVAMLRAAGRYAEDGTFEQMGKVLPAIAKNG